MTLGDISMALKLDISNFAANLKTAEQNIKDTEEKLSGFKDIGNRFSDVGKTLTTSLTLPIVGAGGAAVKFAADLENNMAKISTVADTNAVSLDKLRQGVVNLSNSSGQSTETISQGFYDAISSGVQTTEVIDFMNIAVKTAKGGFSDTATAVNGLTNVIRGYGLANEDATKIANQMMVAQNLGKTTFNEMAPVIGNVTNVASTLGVKTEELFSSLAVLTANGIGTSQSITGLNAAFSNIIKPSSEATKAAETLGLEFNAAAVKSKGWQGFLSEVKTKLAEVAPQYAQAIEQQGKLRVEMDKLEKSGQKNTEKYKQLSAQYKETTKTTETLKNASSSQLSAFAQMFGSVDGLNTVLTLTSDGGMSLYNESMKQMGSSTDYVGQAFDKMNNTTAANMAKMKEQFKNSLAELGVQLLPIVNKVVEGISAIVKAFSNMSPAGKAVMLTIAGIVAAIGPSLMIFGSLIRNVQSIVSVFKLAKEAMVLTKVVGFVTSPTGLIIAAIAGIIFIVYEVIKHWDKIKEVTINVWNAIKDFFVKHMDLIISIILGPIGILIVLIKNNWDKIKETCVNVWNGIKDFFVKHMELIVTVILGPIAGLIVAIIRHWDSIKAKTTEIWNNIVGFFKGIPEKINQAIQFLKDLPGQALTWGKDMIMGFVNGIKNNIGKIIDSVKDVANKIKSFLHFSTPDEGPLADYETWMPDFVGGMAEGIDSNKGKLIDRIKGMAQDMKLASSVELTPAMLGGYTDIDSKEKSDNRQLVVNFYGATIREDSDIDKISRSIYNENQKVTRGMGKRGK